MRRAAVSSEDPICPDCSGNGCNACNGDGHVIDDAEFSPWDDGQEDDSDVYLGNYI